MSCFTDALSLRAASKTIYSDNLTVSVNDTMPRIVV